MTKIFLFTVHDDGRQIATHTKGKTTTKIFLYTLGDDESIQAHFTLESIERFDRAGKWPEHNGCSTWHRADSGTSVHVSQLAKHDRIYATRSQAKDVLALLGIDQRMPAYGRALYLAVPNHLRALDGIRSSRVTKALRDVDCFLIDA